MIDTETICPYTGLRSFSEDESLYFKGRDEHILQVIEQLEQKKFLMVTGASGDGKSSLIFAGLIPHARAGFFKATYSNWNVVSFRPERSPLSNMAAALAAVLRVDDNRLVENELSHGFSSLTEIYKTSRLFIDKPDPSWQEAPDDKKLSLEREAGNLLIVVDQFEEFFTNPENFPSGVPSQDARLVLNIMLETVKISLRDDLPIYVVFTMRSDYIGQCAAFRGLPEFIGFSQFFVPRLQKKELQQVIEEPAILSGNRISKRFVDRLIYDLEDTEDHLPILQHVLKEVWKAADSGREEMDLIHYAMVGGMAGDKLPREDVDRFNQWVSQLPPHRQRYLTTPGLSNVLDIHATRLYEEAASTYNQEHTDNISDKDAKLIIGIAFACLTRIDENRAVRNRMTLEEITRIINVTSISGKVVNGVLRPFRDPEHTLVRPFIAENTQAGELPPDAVLDITHEALIRNWKLLNRWSAKEYEYYNTYSDFKKQLQRWIDNGKSADYLLPIGPLTYFENWFNNCRPNTFWINRYNQEVAEPNEKIRQSQVILDHSRQYLRSSARKLFIAKTFMKYGASRISLAAAMVILITGSGFLFYSWWMKKNDMVERKLIVSGQQLLSAPEADPTNKSEFIIVAERLHPGFFGSLHQFVPDPQQQIEIALRIPGLIFSRNKYSNPPLLLAAMQRADSLIRSQPVPDFSNAKAVNTYLNNWNDLLNVQLDYLYFKSDDKLRQQQQRNARLLGRFIYRFFLEADPSMKWERKPIHIALDHTLNFKALSGDSLLALVATISPFEGMQPVKRKFDLLFPSREAIAVGFNQVIEHNGGYEILANLYASLGQAGKSLMCMDTILKYHADYDLNVVNSRNVAAYFLLFHHEDAFDEFVTGYALRLGWSRYEYMRGFANRAGIFDLNQAIRTIKHGNMNPNLALLSGDDLQNVFEICRRIIMEDIRNPDEKNFAMALLFKHQASLLAKKSGERREAPDFIAINRLLDDAFSFYGKLPARFLEEENNFITPFGESNLKRKLIFIYPDHADLGLRGMSSASALFYSDAFFKYVKERNLWSSLYQTAEDYGQLNLWVGTSFMYKDTAVPFSLFNSSYSNFSSVDHGVIVLIDSLITRSGFEKQLDNSWILMELIRDFLAKGEGTKALALLDRINYDKLTSGRRNNFIELVCLYNYSTQAAIDLIQAGYVKNVNRFVSRFKRRENRIATYAQFGIASYRNKQNEQAEAYLDSIDHEFNRATNITEFNYRSFYDLRNGVVQLMTYLRQDQGKRQILDITGSMTDLKVEGIASWVRTYAELGKYYEAQSVIPELANSDDRLYLYSQILYKEVMRRRTAEDSWSDYDEETNRFLNFTIYGFDNF